MSTYPSYRSYGIDARTTGPFKTHETVDQQEGTGTSRRGLGRGGGGGGRREEVADRELVDAAGWSSAYHSVESDNYTLA